MSHPPTHATLYVPLGEATALITITIQEPTLPSPLEIPRQRPPYLHELTPILHLLARHQYSLTAPAS